MPTIVRLSIEGQIAWKVMQTENDVWVGVCDPLKLTIEGDTYQELAENINDGMEMLLKDLLATGELESFLRQHGWSPSVDLRTLKPEAARFDMPWEAQFPPRNHATSQQAVHS